MRRDLAVLAIMIGGPLLALPHIEQTFPEIGTAAIIPAFFIGMALAAVVDRLITRKAK